MMITDFDCIVIGSGAAGFNAAIRLAEGGIRAALVTEGVNCGTSRNTGSDKQTYYKLGLGGSAPDSVRRMAQDLFDCGGVDGDTALCEAALSARCFYALCELGVEFPSNRFGEYIGYKTDHDPFARATSAGPLTSRFMTEALQKRAQQLRIPVLDRLLAVEILKDGSGVCGLVCIAAGSGEPIILRCPDIVLATGGPAGIYHDSVYPECHTGATSLAIDAGAALQNFTEWQYGLASVSPRWNVSGTYMQALPRFVSTGDGGDEREFLLDFFGDEYAALSSVFLKGYQWPFDSRKAESGSSVIDLLVYRERVLKGRRVWLDYSKNPFGLEKINFDRLSDEAHSYLARAGACFGTPFDRLCLMNAPAAELYRGKGIRLEREYLEIALCAQHCNGGVAVDLWWQSRVPGLFAVGECAGTHGVTRPGGSALNAGQTGSLRAAQYICAHPRPVPGRDFDGIAADALLRHNAFIRRMLANPDNAAEALDIARKRMSRCGAAIREKAAVSGCRDRTAAELAEFEYRFGVPERRDIVTAYKLRDALTVQLALLTAMLDFSSVTGFSRGSALYYNENGILPGGLDELFRFSPGDGSFRKIQELVLKEGEFEIRWRDARPIPEEGEIFESVWRQYRQNRNIF